MELTLKYPPTPEHAKNLADLCVDVARKTSGLSLDYTPESLDAVDRQLEKFRREGLPAEAIASTLFGFGCYVGEVLIRSFGGSWVRLEESVFRKYGGPPIVVRLDSGSSWNPIGKVFNRVDNGEEDNLSYFFRVVKAQAERIRI